MGKLTNLTKITILAGLKFWREYADVEGMRRNGGISFPQDIWQHPDDEFSWTRKRKNVSLNRHS